MNAERPANYVTGMRTGEPRAVLPATESFQFSDEERFGERHLVLYEIDERDGTSKQLFAMNWRLALEVAEWIRRRQETL